MTMIRFQSPRTIARMMQDISSHPHYSAGHHCRHSTPSANVIEMEDKFELEMAIPGMHKDDIKILLEKDILTISSEREESRNENATYNRKEFSHGQFCRSFSLPEMVDRDHIQADYRDGILRIALPKQEESRAKLKRHIEIA